MSNLRIQIEDDDDYVNAENVAAANRYSTEPDQSQRKPATPHMSNLTQDMSHKSEKLATPNSARGNQSASKPFNNGRLDRDGRQPSEVSSSAAWLDVDPHNQDTLSNQLGLNSE